MKSIVSAVCIGTVSGIAVTYNTQPAWSYDNVFVKEYQQPTTVDSIALQNPPATTIAQWQYKIAQAQVITITKVEVETTDTGIKLILETDGELTAPQISVSENAVIADIPNAVLNLEEEDVFIDNPTEGIALIYGSNFPNNLVNITITGTDAPPEVDIEIQTSISTFKIQQGTGATTAENNQDENVIEIIATQEAERDNFFPPTETSVSRDGSSILDTPQTITVIPEELLEQQNNNTVGDALRNAGGVTVIV